MNRKLSAMSQRYGKALRSHLKQGSLSGVKAALRLGRQAVALGIKPLGLARIHGRALKALAVSKLKGGRLVQADTFFNEAMGPIMDSHRTGRPGTIQLERLNKALKQRIVKLEATNLLLRRGVSRHKTMESALRKQTARNTRLLKESLHSQEGLRQLAHRGIITQEGEHKSLSHALQDGIAQELLGINVRLLSLNQETRTSRKHFGNEIASTQRFMTQSARALRRVAQKIRKS